MNLKDRSKLPERAVIRSLYYDGEALCGGELA